VTKEYFSFCQKVDVHNHLRQGELAMEREIGSRKWRDRLAHTLLGIIMVDAYLMYSTDPSGHDNDHPQLQLSDFVNRVCHSILVQKVLEVGAVSQRSTKSIVEEHESITDTCFEMPMGIILPHESSSRRRKQLCRACSVCRVKTSICCGRCSSEEKIIAVCSYRADQTIPCFVTHSRNRSQKMNEEITD
jgi:hypothetical protein